MSNFQKQLFQNRLKQAEKTLGLDFAEDDEEDQEEEDNFGTLGELKSFTRPSASASASKSKSKPIRMPLKNLEPDKEFDEGLPDQSTYFNESDIYRNPESGYLFQTYYNDTNPSAAAPTPTDPEIVLVCHHGAGSTGLTFAILAEAIGKQAMRIEGFKRQPNLFTFDVRGHAVTNLLNLASGDSVEQGGNYQLSIGQLCDDFAFLLKKLYTDKCHSNPNVHFYLVGHSLGGAVITKVLYEQDKGTNKRLTDAVFQQVKGVVMIDIVEETAVKALGSMRSYLNGVPRNFKSLKASIDWHLSSELLHNFSSAKISVPPMFRRNDKTGYYEWVLDLSKTEKFWNDWFVGLSFNFVHITNRISKVLILSNNDYLDKDLMIGQMQGRYQLTVFRNDQLLNDTLTTLTRTEVDECNKIGHFIHEDTPIKMSKSLLEFIERNDTNVTTAPNSKLDMLNKLNEKWKKNKSA